MVGMDEVAGAADSVEGFNPNENGVAALSVDGLMPKEGMEEDAIPVPLPFPSPNENVVVEGAVLAGLNALSPNTFDEDAAGATAPGLVSPQQAHFNSTALLLTQQLGQSQLTADEGVGATAPGLASPQQAHFKSTALLPTQQVGQSQLAATDGVGIDAATAPFGMADGADPTWGVNDAPTALPVVLGGELFLFSSLDVSLDVFSADELVSEVFSVVFVFALLSSSRPASLSSSLPLPESLPDDSASSDSDSSSLDSDSAMLSVTFTGLLNEKDGFTSFARNPVVGRANTNCEASRPFTLFNASRSAESSWEMSFAENLFFSRFTFDPSGPFRTT